MMALRIVGWLIVGIIVAVCITLFMGSRLPIEHTVSRTDTIPASQQKVWALITDVAAQPGWRTGLKSVTPLPPQNGAPCWLETQGGMTIAMCEDVRDAPTREVTRIADPRLPFGGTWTYALEPVGDNATKVTITEDGTVRPVMWRFVAHYWMGEDTTIKQYLSDLKKATFQKY